MKSLELNGLLIRILILKADVYNIQKTHSQITELLGKGVRVKPSRPDLPIQSWLINVDMLAKAKDARVRLKPLFRQALK